MTGKKMEMEDFIGFRIQQTAWNARGQLHKIINHLGLDLTLEQAQVLLSLYKNEGISQIQLADNVFKGRTNITRIISGLVANQLIVRQKDEMDKRCFRIYLTESGREILEELITILENVNRKMIKIIGKDQHQAFMKILDDVNDTISLVYSSYLESLK